MVFLRRSLLIVGVAAVPGLLAVASIGWGAEAPRTVRVKVRVNGSGSVRVAASRPPFICRGGYVCEERLHVRSGRPLVFRASAARGWKLKAWQSGCHDSAVTCSLPLKARLNVTVKFVQGPPSGSLGTLQAVACVSAGDCWAVGYHDTWKSQARLTEALHWDGTTWTQVATPDPGGTLSGDANQLSSVACVSSEDCWATGSYYGASGTVPSRVIALHWDGTTWTRTPVPDGGRASGTGVACAAASFCYLVGSISPPAASGNLALRWNGANWAKASVPEPSRTSSSADYALNGVACTSTANCWAVGGDSPNKNKPLRNQVLRWSGTSWQKIEVPNPSGRRAVSDLNGVACASASDCFAVGGRAGYKTLRWNGTAWKTTPIRNPGTKSGGHILNAVACPAASTCWAVGADNEALRWNGRSWRHTSTPKPAGTASQGYLVLYGISCTSTNNCWAVGSYGPATAHRPETLHWNGTRWTRIPS